MKNPFRIRTAESDFTADMMPKNRRALFFDILKLHWQELIAYGFLTMLFTLPYHMLVIYGDLSTALIYGGIEGMTEAEQLSALEMIYGIRLSNALMTVLCLLLFGIFLAGILRVIRQFSWMENMYFRTDFFSGIKQNVKQSVLICLIFGILYYLSVFLTENSGRYSDEADSMLMLVPAAVLLLIVIPVLIYSVIASSIYSGSVFQKLRVGVIVFSKNIGKTYIAYILSLIPLVFSIIPNTISHLIGAVVGSLAFPFLLLGWYLWTLELLDKDINPEYFPELVGRGIFSDGARDTTDEPDENNI